MEGPQFRKLDEQKLREIAPRIYVLAYSSPKDKIILVKTLKKLGETVTVTGNGTNDAPALKTTDIVFPKRSEGTWAAKGASAIAWTDDNFASIAKGMMWGRAVNGFVEKTLQVSFVDVF
ncbi:plasma membrane calcium [Ceratocystis pirilliformis]|uniref:Plasma membrane calcium n=1 Tax=Ceratocystis pirilliformis TaxID=259994 RepID=A0ABR3YYN1_9PEZI